MIISGLTGKEYSPEECVYIANIIQAARYMKHQAKPVDIIVKEDKICFVFLKVETRALYKEWCARTLI